MLELLSGLAPTLLAFMVLRALFGIAMGGEWGVGSSLTMETIPAKWRGWVSGLLQAGYPSGYLLATIAYGVLYPTIGWRGLFIVGALPALLVVYIRRNVPESPDWHARQAAPKVPVMEVLRRNAGLAVYAVILMTAFNFFSHGTQDIYPEGLPEGAARLQPRHHHHYRDRLQYRRDAGWPHLRLAFAEQSAGAAPSSSRPCCRCRSSRSGPSPPRPG